MDNHKPMTPSEMAKKRWAGVSKEDRRAHATTMRAVQESKRCKDCGHLHLKSGPCRWRECDCPLLRA